MGNSQTRPRPGAPPELDGDLDTLRWLLDAEKHRLEVALRIEEERKIVFPETSVIIHDIQRLMRAIEKVESPAGNGGVDDLLSGLVEVTDW